MKEKDKIGIGLPDNLYKKLKEFSAEHSVSCSELIRVLIENSKIKIETRDKGTAMKESRRDKEIDHKNRNYIILVLNRDLIMKMDEMRLANDTTYSEIARSLIENADFTKIKFNTRNEVLRKAHLKTVG